MTTADSILPTKYGTFKVKVFKFKDDNKEHAALIKGNNFNNEVLVRIHSSCLTGDVFTSLRCDCYEQLRISLMKIGKAKSGVLIYLNQEGRGIGLVNKIQAYALQENGLDTVEANKHLGFTADPRSYKTAAQILKNLNIQKITLLTNNPDKIKQLEGFGITVFKTIPIEITPNSINYRYLNTKKIKMGHKLKLV